jgi:protein TonB
MKRNFALPIAFAAALHGALLFGYHPEPRKLSPVAKDSPRTLCCLPLPPEEPVEVAEATEPGKKIVPPERPRPVAQPEPVAPPVDDGVVMRPPPAVVTGVRDLTKIPDFPFVSPGAGGPGGPGVLALADLDAIPRARLQVAPLYPPEAKREGLHGEVLVEFAVDAAGAVVEARAVRTSHRVFEDAAVRAILKWTFEPGRRNGRIVSFRMVVPVVFSLDE